MLVIVYVPHSVYAIELAAIADTLSLADEMSGQPPRYVVRLVAPDDRQSSASSGFAIMPDTTVDRCDDVADLLIVPSCKDRSDATPPNVIMWLRQQAAGAKRFGATGNGIFILGAAGLIDGRRVTTHWSCSGVLAAAYPRAHVEADQIHVRDGPLFSGAGGVAVVDLMLNLIEEDHGRELALALAREFVLFMQRSGRQSQVSVQLATQGTTRDPIQRVQKHVRDNLPGNLSITALAAIAAMSPRHFSRVFLKETGLRPMDFVEQVRVNQARRMLEESALSPQMVARLSGFSGSEAARRAFLRRVGVTMARYRAQLSEARAGDIPRL